MTIPKLVGVYAEFSYICISLMCSLKQYYFYPSFTEGENMVQKGSVALSILKPVKWSGIHKHT